MTKRFIEEALNPTLKAERLEREESQRTLQGIKNALAHALSGRQSMRPEEKLVLIHHLEDIAEDVRRAGV